MLVFICGGVRSHKSSLGEKLAFKLKDNRLIYLATAINSDEEINQRIIKHQQDRSSKDFILFEKSRNVDHDKWLNDDTVLLDCLGMLCANEMFNSLTINYDDKFVEAIVKDISQQIINLNHQVKHLIVISNDIFSDGITYDYATMQYIKCLGKIHQFIVSHSDIAIESIYSKNIIHKGEQLWKEL